MAPDAVSFFVAHICPRNLLFIKTSTLMRKALLLTLSLCSLLTITQAQIKKGSILLGGDMSFYTRKTDYVAYSVIDHTSRFTISPIVGKAIRDNLVFGAAIGFGLSRSKSSDITTDKTEDYSAGVFLRKYKNIGNSGVYFFLQSALAGTFSNDRQFNVSGIVDRSKYMNYSLSAFPGLSYAVSKKLHLETGFNNLLAINYSHGTTKSLSSTNKSSSDNFSVTSSLSNLSSLYVGFRVLIGK